MCFVVFVMVCSVLNLEHSLAVVRGVVGFSQVFVVVEWDSIGIDFEFMVGVVSNLL